MIVKKILIKELQEEELWRFWRITGYEKREILFFDIETTGLSRERDSVYLIGCLSLEEGKNLILTQWIAQTPSQEEELLEHFLKFARPFSAYIHFNGSRFDLPFLENKFRKYQMESCFTGKSSFDLYIKTKPLKALLKLPKLRQTDLENFLYPGESRENCSGKECISVYRSYQKERQSEDLEILFGHNREDLEGLFRLSPLLSYCAFLDGIFKIQKTENLRDALLFYLDLRYPLPAVFSYRGDGFYLTGFGSCLKISVSVKEGNLRQFYSDYKDYYYLPAEDSAIHKSVGMYMDASLRRPASKETCYTWFPCTAEFLRDKKQLRRYLIKNVFSRIE